MFELTSRAAAALAESRTRSGLGDTIAIRISTLDSGNGSSAAYRVRFASHPSADDLVLESAGLRVFLAAGLAEPLEGSVLDAEDTDKGRALVLKRRRVA